MKKLESGRSMVEMLGVLAIIGVLSVGGIAGYTMAMNRHKANNIINAANMLSTMAVSDQAMKAWDAGTTTKNYGDFGLGNLPTGVDGLKSDKNGVVTVDGLSDEGIRKVMDTYAGWNSTGNTFTPNGN